MIKADHKTGQKREQKTSEKKAQSMKKVKKKTPINKEMDKRPQKITKMVRRK